MAPSSLDISEDNGDSVVVGHLNVPHTVGIVRVVAGVGWTGELP